MISKQFLKKTVFQSFHYHLKRFFRENEFLLLLVSLSAFLLLPSFITDATTKDASIYILLVLVLLVGVYELADSKRSFFPGILFAILTIGFNSVHFSENDDLVFLLRMGSLIAFFGLLTIHVLIRM